MAAEKQSLLARIFGGTKKADSNSLFSEKAVGQMWSQNYQLPNPDKVINLMGGRHRLRELLEDDEIASALQVRLAAAISTPWKLDGGDKAINEAIFNFLTKNLYAVFLDAFDAISFGYNVLELVWDETPDGIFPVKIQAKPIEWFIPQRNGLVKFKEGLALDGVEYPEEKFLLIQHRPTFENPYGNALLTKVFYPYKFRCAGWQFWAEALQKFAVPFIHAQADNFTTSDGQDGAQQLADLLNTQKRGSSIVTPTSIKLNVLGGNLNTGVFPEFEESVNNRIRRTILGQNLTSSVQNESLAAAEVHNDVRDDVRRFDIMLLASVVQRIVNAVHRVNEFSGDVPQFNMQDETGLEKPRAERDEILTRSGMVRFTKEYILDRYDLNETDFNVPNGEVTKSLPASNPSSFALSSKNRLPSAACPSCGGHHDRDPFQFVDRKKLPDNQQKIEALGDDALALSPEGGVARPNIILSVVRSARNEDDLRRKLALLLGDQNEEFEENLTLALYASSFMGYLGGRRDLDG